jgi:hypothetical protein
LWLTREEERPTQPQGEQQEIPQEGFEKTKESIDSLKFSSFLAMWAILK